MHQDDTAREKSGTVPDAELKRIEEERIIYARLHAITGNFIVVYVVDPETDGYREFSATDSYVETFAQAKDGTDFFGTVREAARRHNHPEDLDRFLSVFTKDNILTTIRNNGLFTLVYRLMMEEPDPQAALDNYREILTRVCSRESYDEFLHSGFEVVFRDENRSQEETVLLAERIFGIS